MRLQGSIEGSLWHSMLSLDSFESKSKLTQSQQKEGNHKMGALMCDKGNRVEKANPANPMVP